ncbi:hypothetical protein RN001_000184 [Aquatica leii]|uniref:Regulation of nuclear pre-mRNA domain-containing protein 2 n=1 Tax=Aquatica leii TaxID=1421715 RepID=A0AAN7PEZ7_9COLE|nr:hypothetical protein RN001_000184 [Aquatica leii]
MEPKLPLSDVSADMEFNTIAFEKKLTGLKDSQDSINSCCHWCLQNRQHHKKIVSSWLNVLKRVKIEHRLTLFYLANDVIQYSKRRNYDFVESWGTTLQKATTMVRDEKIKHKILRIFKIWEERGIYGDEFIADLSGLISASPSVRKGDETHEFQSSYLIQKIRTCSKLENDTDVKLTLLKEHNPKIQIESDLLISSLKDRAHVDDVEKELDDYTKQMDNYINALKHEIKSRIQVISLLTQAETQLENDKKDVKLVTTAYRTFSTRVKNLKKKLDEKLPTLSSPVPSPDINAPSPSSDSDIELSIVTTAAAVTTAPPTPVTTEVLFTNPGYYNPVPPPDIETNFNQGNNFSSFIGSNMSFNLGNLNTSSLFSGNKVTSTTPPPVPTTPSYSINNTISSLFPSISCPPPPPSPTANYPYGTSHAPLLPPPMPPFSKAEDRYGNTTYSDSYSNSNSTFTYEAPNTPAYPTTIPDLGQPPPTTTYESFNTNYVNPYQNPDPPLPTYPSLPVANSGSTLDDYNPAEELETWDPEPGWEPPPVVQDTPDSPPMSEKTGYTDPVEYHDEIMYVGASDVDHRVLPSLINDSVSKDGKNLHRNKDVDHRNLISLTGSPSDVRSSWSNKNDQDFRNPVKPAKKNADQDYRVPFIESLKLPPPPPPPQALTNDATDSQFNPNYNTSTNPFSLSTNSNSYSNTKSIDAFTPLSSNSSRINNYAMDSNYINSNLSIPAEYSPRLNDQPTKSKFLNQSKKIQDNVESIDMDLSDDNENDQNYSADETSFEDCFEPPSDLLDDVDANNFLDNVNENLDLEDLVVEDMEPLDEPTNVAAETSSFMVNPMYSVPPPPFEKLSLSNINMNVQEPPPNWIDQKYKQDNSGEKVFVPEPVIRNDFGNFRGRGTIMRGNFNNTGLRGNWVNNNNRGTTVPRGILRGGMNFRGFIPRGRGRGRGFRGRGRGDGIRGRGDFRGRADFRNRGGF